MMLIAGQTWRAAFLQSSVRSRSLLAAFPPRLFVRGANGTKALDDDEKHKHLAQRWPGAA